MAQARQGSKKRSKTALHLWATAGTALAMAGSASAKAPTVEVPSQGTETRIHLAEQEISDVSLGTFYVFDREREFSPGSIRLAAGRCGGGCGCGGHGGGCGGGCGGHPGGCMSGGGCGGHPGGCLGGGCAVHGGGCGGHPGGCGGCGGCRGCGGCGCGVGLWIGGGGGCGGGYGTCWQWDPVLLDWVYVCQ